RSDFPAEALAESPALLAAMEQGVDPLPMETPLVNDAARLRADLWERLGALRAGAGVSCAQPAVACGEVAQEHAGNEFNQQHWRHAKPYIHVAADLVPDAALLAAACAVPPPAPDAAPAQAYEVATVLFAVDRS